MSAAVLVGLLLAVAAGISAAVAAGRKPQRRGASEQDLGPWLLWQALSMSLAVGGLFSMREDLGWWGLALGLAVVLVSTSVAARFARRRSRALS